MVMSELLTWLLCLACAALAGGLAYLVGAFA
jgi:hypothetical protein